MKIKLILRRALTYAPILFGLLIGEFIPLFLFSLNVSAQETSMATESQIETVMNVETFYDNLFFMTVRIESTLANGGISVGSGFLVSHRISKGKAVVFLVTNKHVVDGAVEGRFFLMKGKSGKPLLGERHSVQVPNFRKLWFDHAGNADVTIFNLSPLLNEFQKEGKEFFLRSLTFSQFASAEEMKKYDSIEEIVFVGYPNGIYDTKNFLPVIRQGTVATAVMLDYSGRKEFLIDASVFPGSSGSPVFMKPGIISIKREGRESSDPSKLLLLGMISSVAVRDVEGKIEFIEVPTALKPVVHYQQTIDLGIVIKSEVIREVIAAYLVKNGLSPEEFVETKTVPVINSQAGETVLQPKAL